MHFGDGGSNTLAHTAHAVGGLTLPHLQRLGLGNIMPIHGVQPASSPVAAFGKMREVSKGKDSTTGHWELAGLITEKEFPTFPHGFPKILIERFLRETGCAGYLGNTTASGTAIIRELGLQHCDTGFPIIYTSADSVFQIAAHEEIIPLDRLYEICTRTRDNVCTGEFAVGRVIARPFVGTNGTFSRTANRRDFSLNPSAATMLDVLCAAGIQTVGIGKVEDLFAGRGLTVSVHTKSNAEGIQNILNQSKSMRNGLVFANLVDFDTLYGHRNDAGGFAQALEEFDRNIPLIVDTLSTEDLLIITADHGNDPTMESTDHSREFVPLLCFSKSRGAGTNLGMRETFADVGKTIADYFGVNNNLAGKSFLPEMN